MFAKPTLRSLAQNGAKPHRRTAADGSSPSEHRSGVRLDKDRDVMGRRRGQQVPGSVTVNRLANGCSYPTSAELKTLSDKTLARSLNQNRLRLVRKSPTI